MSENPNIQTLKTVTGYLDCQIRAMRQVQDELEQRNAQLLEACRAVHDGDWLQDEAGTTSDGSTPVSDQVEAAIAAAEGSKQ